MAAVFAVPRADDEDVHSFSYTNWRADGGGADAWLTVAHLSLPYVASGGDDDEQRPWLADGRRHAPTDAERAEYTSRVEARTSVQGIVKFARNGNAGDPAFVCMQKRYVDVDGNVAAVVDAALELGAVVTMQNQLLTQLAPSDGPYSRERCEQLTIARLTAELDEFRARAASRPPPPTGVRPVDEPVVMPLLYDERRWPSERGRAFARWLGSECDERCKKTSVE
jgi:hypothetical protein